MLIQENRLSSFFPTLVKPFLILSFEIAILADGVQMSFNFCNFRIQGIVTQLLVEHFKEDA